MLFANFELSHRQRTGNTAETNIALLVRLAQEAEGRGELRQAEALLKRAYRTAIKHFGEESVCAATILWDLSVVYEQQGKLGEADEIADKVCTILAARSNKQERTM